MTLTQKENSLLSDLKSQEQLCIEKYTKYSSLAHDPELKNLISTVAQKQGASFSRFYGLLNN